MRRPPRSSGAPWCGVPRQTSAFSDDRPAQALCFGLVAGAACHQAAHAVAHDRQFVQRHRPGLQQLLQQRGELAAVVGHVPAAVVVQVQRCAVQRLRQGLAVVVAAARPLPVVHAQAMQQHQHLALRCRQRLRQCRAFQRQGQAAAAQGHVDGQRVAAGMQVVAQHAVEGGDEGLALRRGRRGPGSAGLDQPQCRIDAVPGPADAAAHGAVDQAGQARAAADGQRAVEADARGDGVVHGLDQVGHADAAVHTQPGQATQVGGAQRHRSGRGGACIHGTTWLSGTDPLSPQPAAQRKATIRGGSLAGAVPLCAQNSQSQVCGVLDSKLPSPLTSRSTCTCVADRICRFMMPVRPRIFTAPARG